PEAPMTATAASSKATSPATETPASVPARTEAAPAPPATGELLSVAEVFRADLRVARVKSAARVEKSKKLLRLIVDLGAEERQIVAGIAEKYAPEALV